MIRSVLSIIAGTASWGVLWVIVNTATEVFSPKSYKDSITNDGTILLILLISSIIFSVLAGYITAFFAERAELKHAFCLGLLQISIGIYVQLQVWDLLPLWYNTFFLLMLIPGNLIGGWLRYLKVKKIIAE